MVRSWTIQSDLARGENRVDLYLLGDLSIRLASLTCVGRRCEQGCADGPVHSLPRSRLLAGEAEFRLPGTVCLDDLPVALRNTRRVKGSSCHDLSGDRESCDSDAVWAQIVPEHRRGRPEGCFAEGDGGEGRGPVLPQPVAGDGGRSRRREPLPHYG